MNKISKVIYTVVASIGSAILYRLGGMTGFNTKLRDLGCATVGLLVMLFVVGVSCHWLIHLLSFLLLFGALTTYWDKLFKYDNFYFHGFAIALAYFPYAIVIGFWIPFVIRCLTCAVIMGVINYVANKDGWNYRDWIEELSRGFILVASLSMFVM